MLQVILGKVERFPATLNDQLQRQLLECSDDILTAVGNTMCTCDFYEGNWLKPLTEKKLDGHIFLKGVPWDWSSSFYGGREGIIYGCSTQKWLIIAVALCTLTNIMNFLNGGLPRSRF